MTPKQKRFCEEYLVDLNGTQAAIRSGYSVKTAGSQAEQLLKKLEIREYIDEQMQKMQKQTIASAEEVMEHLTSVLRGESVSEEIMVEGCGEGISQVVHVQKKPSEKDRLRAAELLGKRYGLYTDKTQIDGVIPVVISGEGEMLD